MIVEEFVVASMRDDVINLGGHASTVHTQGMVGKEGLGVALPPASIVDTWCLLIAGVLLLLL